MLTYSIFSLDGTKSLAEKLASVVQKRDVITLVGDLGAGKTTFARFFIRALAGKELEVPSPTFTLVQTYDIPIGTLWHFDLYRLKNCEEVWELGVEDALRDSISLIEWPERIVTILPEDRLEIRIGFNNTDNGRVISLFPLGNWEGRVAKL